MSLDIQKALDAIQRGALAGLAQAGQKVLDESNAHVPQRSGDLEQSGAVTEPAVVDGKPQVTVSYDEPYAIKEHENLTYHHQPGQTAKFLENALTSQADEVARTLADSIRSELRS